MNADQRNDQFDQRTHPSAATINTPESRAIGYVERHTTPFSKRHARLDLEGIVAKTSTDPGSWWGS
jgi:hypothetical protein